MKLESNWKGGLIKDLNAIMESTDGKIFELDTSENVYLNRLKPGAMEDDMRVVGAAGSVDNKKDTSAILGSVDETDVDPVCGCPSSTAVLDSVDGCESDMNTEQDGSGIVEKVTEVINDNETNLDKGEFDPLGLFREMFKVNIYDNDNVYGKEFGGNV